MQEEVENRTLTLVVSGTKFTGRLLKAAISKYMAHCKEKKLQSKEAVTLLLDTPRKTDRQAAHWSESGDLQYRDHRPFHQGI